MLNINGKVLSHHIYNDLICDGADVFAVNQQLGNDMGSWCGYSWGELEPTLLHCIWNQYRRTHQCFHRASMALTWACIMLNCGAAHLNGMHFFVGVSRATSGMICHFRLIKPAVVLCCRSASWIKPLVSCYSPSTSCGFHWAGWHPTSHNWFYKMNVSVTFYQQSRKIMAFVPLSACLPSLLWERVNVCVLVCVGLHVKLDIGQRQGVCMSLCVSLSVEKGL